MAGSLFGLGLSQQFDQDGDPLSGALLYIYLANTSTPVDIWRDVALTLLHPWPLEADSTGRIPSFWLDDGSYRARLTTAGGVPVFDEANILALGPSTGTGGGGDTTDPDSVASTGDVKWRAGTGLLTGWVRMNGQTYGSLTSGGDVVGAEATHKPLYEYLWNTFSSPSVNTICPVIGGLGANASADWNSNKKITLLDMRGKAPFGLDDMGTAAAGSFTGITFDVGNATTGGSKGGDATHTLTTAQLPAHQHAAFIGDDGHIHNVRYSTLGAEAGGALAAVTQINSAPSIGTISVGPGGALSTSSGVKVRSTAGDAASADNQTANVGSGTAHPTISPFMVGTWYQRL